MDINYVGEEEITDSSHQCHERGIIEVALYETRHKFTFGQKYSQAKG